MKVYELMQILSRYDAGMNIEINIYGHYAVLKEVESICEETVNFYPGQFFDGDYPTPTDPTFKRLK